MPWVQPFRWGMPTSSLGQLTPTGGFKDETAHRDACCENVVDIRKHVKIGADLFELSLS